MSVLRRWLRKDENYARIPENQMQIVLHDLQNNAVAIRGGRMFTFTYSLLWNVSQLRRIDKCEDVTITGKMSVMITFLSF